MSLAETGYAPSIFAYVDKSGRPLWALVFMLLFGPLAYINLSANGPLVFNWLVALSGLSTLFTWGTICLCHIRFRKAWTVQGHSIEELPFRAMFGVWGSWAGFILVILVLIAQFYIAISPISGTPSNPGAVATDFFQSYLALPVVVLFYIIGYAWKRTTPQRAHQIDLDVSCFLFFACSQSYWRLCTDSSFNNMYGRLVASVGTPSSRCENTAQGLLPSRHGRKSTASSSRANRKSLHIPRFCCGYSLHPRHGVFPRKNKLCSLPIPFLNATHLLRRTLILPSPPQSIRIGHLKPRPPLGRAKGGEGRTVGVIIGYHTNKISLRVSSSLRLTRLELSQRTTSISASRTDEDSVILL